MDYASVAKKILQRVGGKENVISLEIGRASCRERV